MGVLSARSFVAPLIDKRNLIAIILIGVFFAVYRLSGGTVGTVPKGTRVPMVKPLSEPSLFEKFADQYAPSPADDLKQLRQDSANESAPSKTKAQEDDLLKDMLNGQGTTGTASQGSKRTGQKLDDIERSLGLR